MKYVVTHSTDNKGTVIDGDTLHRFIASARRAGDGVKDDIEWELPPLASYVAERLADLIDYDREATQ